MVSTRSGVRTRPVEEIEVKSKDTADTVPHTQKKAPSKRAKEAKPVKAEEKQEDAVAVKEEEAPVRKSTRVRRSTYTEEAEEPKAPRHVAATKKNELAQAASIPLPEEPIAEQEVEEEEEDEEQDFQAAPAKPTSPAAAKAHVEPAEYVKPEEYVEAADAGQPPSKARKPRTQHHSAAFPWKWIALALCLASLLGAAHHFRHHWQGPLTQRVHQMELHARSQLADTALYIQGPFAKKARAWNHSVRQGFLHKREDFLDGCFTIRQRVKAFWRSLFKGAKTEASHETPCSAQLDGLALESILAPEPVWEGLRDSAQDVWLGHKEDPQKGMGVLMVARTEAAASAATLALQKALPATCRPCFLAFKAGQAAHEAPDAAGAVQKELAAFLQRCSDGVVVLDNAQKLHPALLPVFINALSEQGSFEVDGKSVPAHGALYIATVQDSSDTLDQHDEASFTRKAKKSFTGRLTEHVPAMLGPMTTSHAEALRRRLEVVLPLGN